MKLIENLAKKEYESFCQKNIIHSHFLHSYVWGQFSKKQNHLIPYYIGYKDENDQLVAVALLLQKKLPLGYSYFYAPRGFVIDYQNKKLLKSFTNDLKLFAKRQKAIFIKIDPDLKLHDLDSDGNVIEASKNQEKMVEVFTSLGYRHLGFNQNFEHSQPRFTFRLDLSPSLEEITQHFHPTTRKIINKGNPYHLHLIKNDPNTIDDFFEVMKKTAERENIVNHTYSYYKNFYRQLHKNNMCDLYVVKVNIKELKDIYQDKIDQIKSRIKQLEDPKYKSTEKNKNKKQEFINQLTKAEKDWQNISQIKEQELTLSAILTAKYGNKVWTLHGGNHTLLRELNANYFIYYEIIKDAKQEGYQLIDFFGTTGNPTEDNPVYGIHLFKKRLGGEYLEFIGEMDLVVHKFLYLVFKTLIPIRHKIQKMRYHHQRKKELK